MIPTPPRQAPVGPGKLVLPALCLAVLTAQIDTSVVNLALRPIGVALGASLAALQWVLDGYNLTYAVLLLTGGMLADRYGRRRIFRIGAAVMVLASLACGAAPGPAVLIAARAAAGLGAALLVPASLAIIRVAWPEPAARGRALGVWASCNGLAFVIGPLVGGWLIGHAGWRAVFLVIVPVAAAAGLSIGAVAESRAGDGRRLDLPGQLLGAAALAGLVFAAIGPGWVAGAGLVALAGFLWVERRAGAEALVPLDLFAAPAFRGAMAATATMTFGIYGMIFLVPLAWLAGGTLSPAGAGAALLPCAGLFFLVSPVTGALLPRLGARRLIVAGTGAIAAGLAVLAGTAAGRPLWLAEIGLGLTGIGMGIATGPLMALAVGAVREGRAGTASSLINVARMVGATLGVAVAGAVYRGAGLSAAMALGAAVQAAGGACAWAALRWRADGARCILPASQSGRNTAWPGFWKARPRSSPAPGAASVAPLPSRSPARAPVSPAPTPTATPRATRWPWSTRSAARRSRSAGT